METLVDIAQHGVDVEVRAAELRNTGNERVFGVDLEVAVGEGVDGGVGNGTAVPVRWEALGNVFEFSGFLVEFGADDGGDGCVVGDTAGAPGAVGEEVGVEGEGSEGDYARLVVMFVCMEYEWNLPIMGKGK